MQPFHNNRGRRISLLIAVVAASVMAQGVFEELRLPLEHYPDGSRRSELTAHRATVMDDGRIEGRNVIIRFYAEDGSLDSTIESDRCIYNRASQAVSSRAPVRMVRPGMRLTGVGFRWDAGAERIHIRSQARLELERGTLDNGLKTKKARHE